MMALSKRRAARPRRPDDGLAAVGHRVATGSCSARAPASSCSSPRSTPWRAARGSTPRCSGAGITADSHDIAQPDPAGRGGTRAILRALEEAEITPTNIVHINAHATSTPQGDIAEGLMIHATLGAHADRRRRDQHQVDDRSPARRRRRPRGDRHGAGPPPPGQPADDQPRRPGPAGRARHRRPRRATCRRATSPPSTTPSASAAPTSPSPSEACDAMTATGTPSRPAKLAARGGPAQPGAPAHRAPRRGHAWS